MAKLMAWMQKNQLIHTMMHLQGNPRICLWTEPLWGIPYNLYAPYVSVYMAALGMDPLQIGVVNTVFFASQMVWALLSGVLADKLGRRWCTLIFDTISWSVPTAIWMLAQDFTWFLVAAVFNGCWRVTENSWGLLLAEDAEPEVLPQLFAITHVAGLCAGFVAPLAYFFVRQVTVVPAMRVLYGLACVMMTAKFLILFFKGTETAVGKRRMEATRHISIPRYLLDSLNVLKMMVTNRRVMLTVALLTCYGAVNNVFGSFWSLLVTQKLGILEENLSIFSTIKSLLLLVMYFVLVPRLRVNHFLKPMIAGLSLMLALQLTMVFLPQGAYALVVLGVVVEAIIISILSPLVNALAMINAEQEQRARIFGWFYFMSLAVTSPFGVIAGSLSKIDRSYPFYLTAALSAVSIVVAVMLWRVDRDGGAMLETAPQEAPADS